MKLLAQKYKTPEGATKRCAFENGAAKFEFEHGYKARHYKYRVTFVDCMWRVARYTPEELNKASISQ
jgi:hypothetical protein